VLSVWYLALQVAQGLLDHRKPVATLTAMAHQPEKVLLLVDDDPDVLKLYGLGLQQQGFRVMKAGTAAVALQRARELGRLDLLITDFALDPADLKNAEPPSIHGIELIRRIKHLHPNVRVILFSGHPHGMIERIGGIPPAGTAFLQKPFTVEVLTDTIKRILRTPTAVRKKRK
jgi:two-component system cell cycle response regulator CpdR